MLFNADSANNILDTISPLQYLQSAFQMLEKLTPAALLETSWTNKNDTHRQGNARRGVTGIPAGRKREGSSAHDALVLPRLLMSHLCTVVRLQRKGDEIDSGRKEKSNE